MSFFLQIVNYCWVFNLQRICIHQIDCVEEKGDDRERKLYFG